MTTQASPGRRSTTSRRTFLRLLGLGGVAAAGGVAVLEREANLLSRAWRKVFGSGTSSLAGGVDEVVRVGRRYLALYPEERSRRALEAAVGGPEGDELGWLQSLAPRIRRDFANGLTVDVDGWLLSRTEARVAALLALRD